MQKGSDLPADRTAGELARWIRVSAVIAAILGLGMAMRRLAVMNPPKDERELLNAGMVLCFLWALAVLLYSLFSPAWQRRARRRQEEEASERLRQAGEETRRAREEKRRQWAPHCLAWDEFQPEAGALAVAMDTFRYEHKPNNWREIMTEKARAALLLAEPLYQAHRRRAEELIRPFCQAADDDTPDSFAMPLYHLRDWLFETGKFYWQVKQEIGPLTPPSPQPPAPPSSRASARSRP